MKRLPTLIFPSVVSLETTSKCNSRCVMCVARDKVVRDPDIMPPEKFEAIVNQCFGQNVVLMSLTHFGEPLLDPYIVDRVRYIRATILPWVRIAIWTNATLLTPELAAGLIDAGLTNMNFSIDSMDVETYASMRVGLRYKDAYAGVQNFVSENEARGHPCQTRVHATTTRLNQPEIAFLVRYWENMVGIDGADWLPAESGRDIDPTMSKNVGVLDPCASPFNNFTVQSDGKVVLCCKVHDGADPLGDAFEQSIEEIWYSNDLDAMRELHNTGHKMEIPICAACGAYR